ncbi:ABC transporter substrate-binding protein, partial [Streptomyces sp. T-3]|nr:ABC transporter substrate-binding protein [Streptomyces sp. T-3]
PAPEPPAPDHARPTATTAVPPAAHRPATPPPTPERPAQPPAAPQFPPAFPPQDQLPTPAPHSAPRALRRPLTVGLAALVTLGVIVAAAVFLPGLGEKGSNGSGGQNPGSGGSDGGSGGSTAGNKVVTIAVDAPLTGDLAGLGLGIKNSADLAVRQANDRRLVDGVTFKLKAVDDRAQPATGQQNASELVADKDVLGVVGPLNASVAQSMQEPLDEAQLALVSPATSNPLLTRDNDGQTGKPSRPFDSFFRTAPLDPVHGSIAARHLYRDEGRKKAYVIDDTTTYGVSIADAFKEEFTELGGSIVGVDHASREERDFRGIADKAVSSGADVVYFGGDYLAGGPLCAQLNDADADMLFAGGDGLYSAEFIDTAQQGGASAYVTSVAEAEDLPSAKDFVKRYKEADYRDAYGSYGAYAYDATWAILQAVKATVDAHDGKVPQDARPKVVAALQRVSFDGVTGPVAFDGFGDATSSRLGVYTVENGEWKLAKQVSYQNKD